MWSTVGPVILICKVSHDIKSVQHLIPEFIPSQQCHSVRNTDPVVTWLWMFLVVLSSHIQMASCYIKIFVYKHKVNRWPSTSNCQGWQIHECP